MKSSDRKAVKKMVNTIVMIITEYVDADDGVKESAKIAVSMTAVTKVLAGMATTLGVPHQLVHTALDAELESFAEAVADHEQPKH